MTETEIKKRGSAVNVGAGAFIGIMAFLIVVPGFVSGFYCSVADAKSGFYIQGYHGNGMGMTRRVENKALRLYLGPANLLSQWSLDYGFFFMWEFDLATGAKRYPYPP